MGEPLRICKICGVSAFTEKDLNLFVIDKKTKYGHTNICKKCKNKRHEKGTRYYETQLKRSLEWKHRNKEHLKKYDKERYDNFPEKAAGHRKRRLRLNFKTIYLPKNPRKNICSICGQSFPNNLSKQTTIHHWFYFKAKPLSGSTELCGSCHKKLPKIKWIDCDCGVRYDGWLYKKCPICQTINPSFSLEIQKKYILKIREVFNSSIHI